MTQIKFGTDGWRAEMDTAFTFENVEILAQAFSDYVRDVQKSSGSPRVVIGYDFRRDSENFADHFARVLIANGIRVTLSDRAVPTPAVSRAVITDKYDFGIAVTASHNPAGYNGIKIKDADGSSADKSVTDAVEACIKKNPVRREPAGSADSCHQDLLTPYLKCLVEYLDLDVFQKRGFKVLMDSMHGVGERHIEAILRNSPLQIETLRPERDVKFGGVAPEPIPKNITGLMERMKTGSYDAGFVTDGDADRIAAVRPGGDFVTPGAVLSLILLHLAEDRGRKGDVVTTVSNTSLINRVARGLGLKIHETPVGFKYLVDVMRKHPVLIAGEESGGIAFENYMFERDGLLSALLVIQMMEYRGQTMTELLNDMERRFGKFRYARKDFKYPDELKIPFMEHVRKLETDSIEGTRVVGKNLKDGVKFLLENDAWLLFRMSGTEPLLRIYAESQDEGAPERLVAWGEKLAFSLTQ
ncbi:MAG: phosphoglucomutase/phosphomannomutase family protein [Candidatus Omnitrophica bacterium]|nr:phosphoglucomutase/phosphomannomutase family protein [Candidatus Omnitrophota bacterium]